MPHKKPCRVRQYCQNGALLQAIRDIRHNFPLSKIPKYLQKRFTYMTDAEAAEVIKLAQQAINAGRVLQFLPDGERLSPGWIPRLPE